MAHSYDEKFNQQSVKVHVGEHFIIRLPENRSTGFSWHLIERGGPACILVSDQITAAGTRPGQGIERVYTLQAAQSGECDIKLHYVRPWETAVTPQRTFAIHIRVEDPSPGTSSST
jgi:predicted secreted protein